VFTTRDDNVVPVKNSIAFIDALDKNGISFESHIYSYGPHGYSTGDPSVLQLGAKLSERAPRWVKDSIGWLGEIFGVFGAGRPTDVKCPPRVNDDGGEFFTVDCTLGYLLGFENVKALLNPIIEKGLRDAGYGENVDAMGFLRVMKLRDVLMMANAKNEEIEALDAQLKNIK